jgi:hypothetical protein
MTVVENTSGYQYSRRLAPWCFDVDGSEGTPGNKYFWGCAMNVTRTGTNVDKPRIANYTTYRETVADINNRISFYTSDQNVGYAVVRPSEIDGDIDWSGKSYAVSTKCGAIPRDTCTSIKSNITDARGSYNCQDIFDGRNQTMHFAAITHALWFYDWHRDLAESAPFTASFDDDGIDQRLRLVDNSTVVGATPEDTNKMFRNPWRWLAQLGVPANTWDLPEEIKSSPSLWEVNAVNSRYVLSCSTTGNPSLPFSPPPTNHHSLGRRRLLHIQTRALSDCHSVQWLRHRDCIHALGPHSRPHRPLPRRSSNLRF